MQGLYTQYPAVFQKGRKSIDYNSPESYPISFFAPSYEKYINNIDNINYTTAGVKLYSNVFVDIFDNTRTTFFEVSPDSQLLQLTPKGMNKVPTFGHYVYDCMKSVDGKQENETTELSYILDSIHDYIKDRIDSSLLAIFDGQNLERENANNAVYIKIDGIDMNGGQMVGDGLYMYDTTIKLLVSFLGNYEVAVYVNDFVNNVRNPDFNTVDQIACHRIGEVLNATSVLDGANYLHKYVLPLQIRLIRTKTEVPPEYVVTQVEDLIVNIVT